MKSRYSTFSDPASNREWCADVQSVFYLEAINEYRPSSTTVQLAASLASRDESPVYRH